MVGLQYEQLCVLYWIRLSLKVRTRREIVIEQVHNPA